MKDLERIYKDNFIKVYRYILSISGDEMLAEEITQETFYRAMRSLKDFREDCSVATWLCTIGRNLFYDSLTRRSRSDSAIEEMGRHGRAEAPGGSEESAEQSYMRREKAEEISQVIRDLDDPYGEVLALRLYSELSFGEIGRIFGKSDSWARVVYHRGRLKAREELRDENQV